MLLAVALMAVAANPYLEEGRAHFANLDFGAAARAMEISVGQPGLDRDELREAFDVWAQALLALGRRDDAERTYARLLRDDPYAPAPAAAPKVRECFERAKRSVWPPPSVKLSHTREAERVTVMVFDPWGLVQRLRFLQATQSALVEGPVPVLTDRAFTVTPSVPAQRLLFDALDAGGAMLAHLEVPLDAAVAVEARPAPSAAVEVAEAPAAGRSGAPALVAAGASLVAAGLSASFFYLGYRGAPPLTHATEVNAWNSSTTRDAVLAWSFATVAAAAALVAVLVALR